MQVDFDEPQKGVTPGQAAVFYDDDRVLGGGWISSSGTRDAERDAEVRCLSFFVTPENESRVGSNMNSQTSMNHRR